ncbi:metabotropic glutamate receptor-like protein p [Anaeramoeba flamelloides]|uniref:Metabotropic glutamate receptor-like protein p n=1 Tax=Anaeramoeba flamelloides TaxID=1746091 RepID=A0AAV7ZRT6_9EUKA|nr:metabotropic glutamate receptor-like protein p [Anaeramoeba flamelloides]
MLKINLESEEEKKKYESERKVFIDNFILALKSQDEQIKNLVGLLKVLLGNNKQVEKNNSVLKNKIRMSKYIDYQFVKSKQDFQQVNDRILQSLPRQAQRYRQELDRGELTKIQLQQEITKLNKQIEQQNQESLQKLKSKIRNLQEQINDSKQEQKEIISQSEKQKQFLEIQIQGFEKIITQKNKNNDLNNTNKNKNNLNNNNNPQQQNQSFQSKQQLLTNVISKTSSLNNTSTTTSTNKTSTSTSSSTKTATKTNVPINKTTNSQLQPSIKKILKTTVELKSEKKSFGRYKWNKRFFELDNGILAIYDKENGSCELKIDIKEDGRSIKKKVEQKKKCCIEIRTSDSTFLFSLENLEEQTTWYRSFREARF